MSQTHILPSPSLQGPGESPGKWLSERAAFWRLLPSLFAQYHGQYVAIHGGEVVDSGDDQVALALRIYRRFGYIPIYVGRVSDQPPETLRLPSPRILEKAVP